MRQVVIVSSLIGSFTIFAMTINLFDTLVMFLLFGILPGQDAPLSANQMLTIYLAAAAFVAGYSLRSSVVTVYKALRVTTASRAS